MKILSVDPGLHFTGWAIITKDELPTRLVSRGVICLKPGTPVRERLYDIYFTLFEIISVNHITHLALETPFLGKNAATFLKLGYIRGLLLLLSQIHGLSLDEFSPKKVKLMVTGSGNSDKEAVSNAVMRCFPGLVKPDKYDITDAIAVGICALRSMK
jgi:crossover junction endodeoxyribonuclease RuvC